MTYGPSRWRVAVLDSGWDGDSVEAARFLFDGDRVLTLPKIPDTLGHGTRVSEIIHGAATQPMLLVAQVLDSRGISTPSSVAAAIRWATEHNSHLIHLSLGVGTDRLILEEAVRAAVQAGVIIIAASPARGPAVFPASYPGVLRGTGDARCLVGDLSHLGSSRFGGAARYGRMSGSSIGAAYVTRAIVEGCAPGDRVPEIELKLAAVARFRGVERRRQ